MKVENIKQLLSGLYFSSNYKGVIELSNIIELEYKLFHNEDIQFMTLTYKLMAYYALNDFQQALLIYKKIGNLQSVSNNLEHEMVYKLFSYVTKYVGNDLKKIEETLLESLQISLQLKAKDMTYTLLLLNNYALILKDSAQYSEMEKLLNFLVEMMMFINKDIPFLFMIRAKLNLMEAYLYNNKKQSYERLRDEIGVTISKNPNHFIVENLYFELLEIKYEILFNPKVNSKNLFHFKQLERKIEKLGLIELRFDLYQFLLQNDSKIDGLDTEEYKLKFNTLQEEVLQYSEKN